MVDTDTIRDWRGQQNSRPVTVRKLAAAFRAGETLHVTELVVLRDYAAENGLLELHARVKEELRTEKGTE